MAGHLKPLLLLQLVVNVWLYCSPVTLSAQTNNQIVMNVSVLTENRTPVGGLGRDNFSVDVDKVPQNIVMFSDREVPVSVGILIDTSGSFDHGKQHVSVLKQNLKEGLERFLKLGHPANEYFVMSFNKNSTLVQDWTSDSSSVTNIVDSLQFKSQTSLYDAIITAIPKVNTGRNAKQVLIVFTDGMDNNSKNSFKRTREALKRSDVLLYAVGFFNDKTEMRMVFQEAAGILDELAGCSAGEVVFAKNASREAFYELFEHVALELRGQYQLSISLPETSGKEKWHKIKVRVARTDPSSRRPEKLYIRAKEGYYR